MRECYEKKKKTERILIDWEYDADKCSSREFYFTNAFNRGNRRRAFAVVICITSSAETFFIRATSWQEMVKLAGSLRTCPSRVEQIKGNSVYNHGDGKR